MAKPRILNKVINQGGTVLKSFLGLGPNRSVTTISSNSYRNDVPFGPSGWLFDRANGGMDVHFSYSGLEDVVRAYECCAPVYSIVNKQAYAFTNGTVEVVNRTGKGKGKEANSEWAKKVKNLLKRPNPMQNWKQFEAQAGVYLRLFGYCVIFPIKPAGFPNEDATALWIIPPYLCTVNLAKRAPFNLKRGWIENIIVKYGDEKTTLTPDQVIVLRDITPGFANSMLPGSPIKPIQKNINNLIGIYDSKGVLINYRGALGILTPEVDPQGAITVDPEEKAEIETGLMMYGLRSNQSKFIVANSAMRWQQMGVPYRDLMLTEWAEDETMVICDALIYPYKLLANTRTSSLNGTEVEAFKKQLYQDFVIPFAAMIYEQIEEAFNAEANNCVIKKCYDHIQALQEDSLKAAQTRKQANEGLLIEFYNNKLTLNRWQELLGEEAIEVDGDLYYKDLVAKGWVFGAPKAAPAPADQNNTDNNTPASGA